MLIKNKLESGSTLTESGLNDFLVKMMVICNWPLSERPTTPDGNPIAIPYDDIRGLLERILSLPNKKIEKTTDLIEAIYDLGYDNLISYIGLNHVENIVLFQQLRYAEGFSILEFLKDDDFRALGTIKLEVMLEGGGEPISNTDTFDAFEMIQWADKDLIVDDGNKAYLAYCYLYKMMKTGVLNTIGSSANGYDKYMLPKDDTPVRLTVEVFLLNLVVVVLSEYLNNMRVGNRLMDLTNTENSVF